MHYFRYATGKNSADMSLAVDAMALANTGQFDGVGIASSDSDFTPLAIQLRMQGLRGVWGAAHADVVCAGVHAVYLCGGVDRA